jgi:hypothetical protein
MNRWKVLMTCGVVSYSVLMVAGKSQHELIIDTTNQPSPPMTGRGPFPGSPLPGHSPGFPVRLDVVASGKLEANGTTLIDFIITNIGTEAIKLPFSVDGNTSLPRDILTLYLTSDAIEYGQLQSGESMLPFQPTSAELYAQRGDPKTFYLLAPSKALRVHASTRFRVKPGTHSFTGHAQFSTEVVSSAGLTGEVLGTVEAIPVEKMFSAVNLDAR